MTIPSTTNGREGDFSPDTIQAIVNDQPAIQLVYLFGSRVAGQIGPASDYDFALLVDYGADGPGVRAAFAHAIARLLVDSGREPAPMAPDRIDVILLHRAPIELAYHVVAQGRCLYKRSETTRVEYEATVLSRYGDYLPILRQHRKELQQKEERNEERIQRYRTALERTQRTLAEARAAYQQRSE
jgi:uncharacterized protein